MTQELTVDQRRVLKVLERITEQVRTSADDAEVYGIDLEAMLDRLIENDFFGTEGQNDPRGDVRDGAWSLYSRVQGVDE